MEDKKFPNELARFARLEKVESATHLGGSLSVTYQRQMGAPAIVAEAAEFAKASADAIAQGTGAH